MTSPSNGLDTDMSTRTAQLLLVLAIVSGGFLSIGCTQPNADVAATKPATRETLNADTILRRSAEQYAAATTTSVRGTFEQFKAGQSETSQLQWVSTAEGKARVEVGRQIALLHGPRWWMVNPVSHSFIERSRGAQPAHDLAAATLTNGVILPALKFALEAKRIANDPNATRGWKLHGMNWHDERPCFTLQREFPLTQSNQLLRLAIDQESFVIRAAEVLEDRETVDPIPLWRWTYTTCALNEPIAPERLAVDNPPRRQLAQSSPPVRIRANGND